MAVIRSSDLDFDQIKANLKTYLEQQDEFSDYNFEASGLSNILDVLAYNTHINGLIANFGINESFLGSAQLRSSVVSHAETLGYFPRSRTGAAATITLTISTSVTDVTTVTIPQYTTFTAVIDNISYTFQTLEEYTATNDGAGLFTVVDSTGSTSIRVVEGLLKTKTFIVGDTTDEQVYVIPDANMDTSTVVVNVYDTTTSASYATYTNVNSAIRIDADSTIYILREAPNGYYEITFSDGNVLGSSPVAGNKIEVQYLQTNGPDANDATVFVADDQIDIGGTDYILTPTLVSRSAGGAEKETIASIKANAPLAFASQQRLVTADDYTALILRNYSAVLDDVTAWGGNDNVPPQYGKVFVSLKFKTNIPEAIQQTTKDSIITQLSDNLAIMSIDTEFSDPTTTYLEIITTFNFDPDLSGNTLQSVEAEVQSTVTDYVATNLNTFDGTFRRSNVLSLVDDISPAVLNSRMDVKIQQRFTPTLALLSDFTINFPVVLADPDDEFYRVTSTRFTFGGRSCILRNQLSSNKLQIVSTAGTVVLDNAGTYSTTNGTVNIRGVTFDAYEGASIKISVTPANQSTIKPLRNYILDIDGALSIAQGVVDYQNTEVTL
jgi:hypothetical protein